jgi:hypothetical protein
MEQNFKDKLITIFQSVKILSNSSYQFRGKTYHEQKEVVKENKEDSIEIPQGRSSTFSLESTLYRFYHCRKESIDEYTPGMGIHFDNRDFVNELSQNNFGKGTWESGWKIVKMENNGQIAATKNDLTLWFNRMFFRLKDNREKLSIGKYGHVLMPKEFRNLLPGFYTINGNATQNEDRNTILVRVYWNINNSSASKLVKLISTQLNNLLVPFRFKVLNNPLAYPRADGGVLYIYKDFFKLAEDTIHDIYFEIKDSINFETPYFAKTIAPGLSIAEDPNTGESFGQNRCRLLAEALYLLYAKRIESNELKIHEIKEYFRDFHIDLKCAYLNANSIDDYNLVHQGKMLK